MLTERQKIVVSFLFALITFGAMFLAYQLTMCLYSIFGIMVIFCLIGFITLWIFWYLI